MNRLHLFYLRFLNQYRIHKNWVSLRDIIKWAWIQSKIKKI